MAFSRCYKILPTKRKGNEKENFQRWRKEFLFKQKAENGDKNSIKYMRMSFTPSSQVRS